MQQLETVTIYGRTAFHALGLDDADDLVLRAELMRRLAAIVRDRGLTQVEAGGLMSMDQPRVPALMNGRIAKFSTDRLLQALSDLGQDVELRITPARTGKGRISVGV